MANKPAESTGGRVKQRQKPTQQQPGTRTGGRGKQRQS